MCRTLSIIAAAFVVATSAVAAPSSGSLVALSGLDPMNYMQRRNRQPDVGAELRARPIDDVLRVLADDGAVQWPKDEAYAPGLKPDAKQRLRQRERQAVKHGALLVLAESGDARAAAAITAAIDDVDDAVAAVAAMRLGQLRDETSLPTLTALAHNDTRALAVRAGACAGLGRLRSAEALEALLVVVAADTAPALRSSAMEAIETLTSRWAFDARKQSELGQALRARAADGLAAIALDGDLAARRDLAVKRLSR